MAHFTRAILAICIAALVIVMVTSAVLIALLHPTTDEWAMPVRVGPFSVNVGVPSVIRLLSTPPIAQRLNGQRVTTPAGTLVLGWQGRLSPQRLELSIDVPTTPLHQGFAAFSAYIPELARARIASQFALQATLDLPAGTLHATPQIAGFGVAGLGTEALRGVLPSSCTPSALAAHVSNDSILARAVLAAEDQRFMTHPGYDLTEWTASMQANQAGDQRLRGASTLTQQVARLLFTGADRTPARKLRELLYAVEMERTLGKPRILQLYLQNAPWGDGVCGAEAAAQHYFQRPAARLAPAQAVWLAAMLHAPDPHAQAWRRSGHIDTARAQWVASQVRPLTHRKHATWQRQLAAPRWPAPAAPVRAGD